jgi:hypothetical protein
MPERNTRASPGGATAAEQGPARIAACLRAARLRTGLSEQQVVDLLAQQGIEVTIATVQRWETSGLVLVDVAAHLADAYGTTIDSLAGRRAFTQRRPTDDLPPAPRSAW